MARLAAASAIRRTLATFFIAVSTAYIRARRVVEGTALQHALQPASTVAQFAAHLVSIDNSCKLLCALQSAPVYAY